MPRLVYAAIVLLIVSGCHPRPALTNSNDDAVTFTARDHAFDGPTSMSAGHVTIRLVNQGQDPHHAQLIRLSHGKTTQDFIVALKAEPFATPSWAQYAGGPNAVMGNETTEATLDLE